MEAELIVALVTLIGMEVVLGIDNLVFIAILSNRLPGGRSGKPRGGSASAWRSCSASPCWPAPPGC